MAPQDLEELSVVHEKLNFQEVVVGGFGPMYTLKGL